jgi:uncharacterized protein DUF3467
MAHDLDDAADEGRAREGRYANYIAVGHNLSEFVLDFAQFFLEDEVRPRPHTRIITSPSHAKTFWTTLGRSIEQYERSFGLIRDDDE